MIKIFALTILGVSGILGACERALAVYEGYEVLFTKPVCPERLFSNYRDPTSVFTQIANAAGESVEVYEKRENVPMLPVADAGILTRGGEFRKSIPPGVFCTSADFQTSVVRVPENPYRSTDSPYNRLEDIIGNAGEGDDIFVASFTFSQRGVAEMLCKAGERGARMKLLLHKPVSPSQALLRMQNNCPNLTIHLYEGSRLAHFKTFIIHYKGETQPPERKNTVMSTFESANITSGTWGLNENWNFVSLPDSHWFASEHLCLARSIDEVSLQGMQELSSRIERCRNELSVDIGRDADKYMTSYMIPKSGGVWNDKEELKKLPQQIAKSQRVLIAAHHLSHPELILALQERLRTAPNFEVKVILDSEVFWSSHNGGSRRVVDDKVYYSHADITGFCRWGVLLSALSDTRCSLFLRGEYFNQPGIDSLVKAGAQVRFFEANNRNGLLFHHKFLIFDYAAPEGPNNDILGRVFTGAGNLSKGGFETNFENYYLVGVPRVVDIFKKEFNILFEKAVTENSLPLTWDYETTAGSYAAWP